MKEHESYIENRLEAILKLEEIRVRNLRATHPRHFQGFYKGDRVSLLLRPIDAKGPLTENDCRIESVLIDPEHALVDVKYIEGDLNEWLDRQIGLATWYELRQVHGAKIHLAPYYVAGDQGVAYFNAEDLNSFEDSTETVKEDKIKSLALKYGRLAVDGMTIFDFMTPRPK